jgi:hypothetical protein
MPSIAGARDALASLPAQRVQAETLLLTGVVAVAAWARLFALAEVPPGFHGDEAISGLEAQHILQEGWTGPWSPSAMGQPAGPFYWTALWLAFLPDTLFTVRLASAAIGIAAVPVFYLFCRECFGARPAAIAAVMLAFSFWHIHFSRTAFPLATVPLVACASLYFLALGVNRGRLWAYALAGVFLGLGIYTYGAFTFFPLALILPVLLLLWQGRRPRALLARRFGGLTLMAVAALLVAGPYLLFSLENSDAVLSSSGMAIVTESPEFQTAGLTERVSILWDRAWAGSKVYWARTQNDLVDGLGSRGLLDPASVALFALGILVALWRVRDWRHALLICGLLAGLLPAVLITNNYEPGLQVRGEYRRNIIALPFVFACIGLGAELLLGLAGRGSAWLSESQRTAPFRARGAILRYGAFLGIGVAVALGAAANIHHYLVVWPRQDHSRWVFGYEMARAVRWVQSVQPEAPYDLYFYSSRWDVGYPTMRFLLPDARGEDRSREFGTFELAPDPDAEAAVYIFLQEYTEVARLVEAMHPGGVYVEERDAGGKLVFTAYYLPGPGPLSK